MKEIRWERMAAILICIMVGVALAYLFLQYVLPLLLPFLLAYGIAMLIRPVADKISKGTHLPRGLCSAFLLLVIFGIGGWGIWAGSVRLIAELGKLLERLLSDGGILDAMDSLMLWAEKIGARFGFLKAEEGNTQALYDAVAQMVGDALSSIATRLPELAANLFSALPSILFFLVVSVVACFYFCMDGVQILRDVSAFLPSKWRQKLPRMGQEMGDIFRRYIKAYGILMAMTFALLLVGFWMLRVEYAVLLAFLIALADLLPVIGVGTILIPWGIVMLLQKNFYVGFGLLILYLIISLVRQVAEPKVLGKSLGLNPLLTLFATYVGFSLFGILGMILAPVAMLLCKRILTLQTK